MYETTLDDLHVGDEVRAFHPLTLGVVHYGRVTKLGRKYVSVRFNVTAANGNREFVMHPKYVTEVL